VRWGCAEVPAPTTQAESFVNAPFDFVAGGETLPAGTYSVSRVSTKEQPDLLIPATDAINGFISDGLFIGQTPEFSELVLNLAHEADAATRS